MQTPYTVINASAGSGKTYNLVQRILMICLKNKNQQNTIQNILALTFTNKAANEMKERILSWLKDFSSENYENNRELASIQKSLKAQGFEVSLKELHERSKKLLDFILHNYSSLNIGTIDKFNSKLVRSFTYELGLAKNFNLEINAEPFLIEAVDQFLEKVGDEKETTESLMNYIHYYLDQNEKIQLNSVLYDSAKKFISDVNYEALKSNKNFDNENYKKASVHLREEIKNLKKNSTEIAKRALQLMVEKGIEPEDFYGGARSGIAQFFIKYLKEREATLQSTKEKEENKTISYQKGASAKGKHKESEIFSLLNELMEMRMYMIRNEISIQKKEKFLNALLPLKVHQEIQEELQKIEEENDVVLLNKFNTLIHENLQNEPSEFIYEKIGTHFQHYFFDEFQDTSLMQWQNFLPLRDHSVSMENTSFTLVGDPKQSIYRFRGGESQIMLEVISGKEKTPKKAEVITLKENWRSGKNIVDFNNRLYQYISKDLTEEHQNIFGEKAQQSPQSSLEGRVKIHLVNNENKDVFYEEVSMKMQKEIQECINNGFKFSDITILCRGNNDIYKFSQHLTQLKVQYLGELQYIKTISESGLTLDLSHTLKSVIHFLQWKINPKNKKELVQMLYYLKESGRISMQDFTFEVQKILILDTSDLIEEYLLANFNLNLKTHHLHRLNLYHYIENFVREFSVENKEVDFLLSFLEVVYHFSQNAGATTKDFVKYWHEEAHKKTVQASENIDAIELTTIHKAKGLEFPVVFLPFFDENKDNTFEDWFILENDYELKNVNLKRFKTELEVYDEEIENFNVYNSYKNKIDRLCLQYVATTRAVEQMFLFIQKPKELQNGTKESNLEIYNFVRSLQISNTDEFDLYSVDAGQVKKQSKPKIEKYQTKNITQLHKNNEKKSSVVIATPSKSYQQRKESVRMGIFQHEILSQIHTKKDIEKVLESYLLEGIIHFEESKEMKKQIQSVIQKYPEYFLEENPVLNEREIMISEDGISKNYRPDRLVETKDGIIIIDFKTGEQDAKHEKQLATYKTVLEKIGRKVAGSKIIYL